ncbi:MAG: hypothetical protein LW606_00260 [Ilumatobacteraceae bacterium]|jgi:hypothetical protein|nr:hypothetical protein [Ilumatobacteraceae bacterium]
MSLRVPALSKGVRRGPETLLGLALVLGGGLAALALRDDAGELTKVVGTTRPLQSGHVIKAEDLDTFEVPKTAATQFLDVSESEDLIGAVIISDLAQPGPLPIAVMTRLDASLTPGHALVAVALDEGQYPPSVAVGHRVIVTVRTQRLDGQVGTTSLTPTAVVAAVAPPSEFQPKTVVTLRSPSGFAEDIAAAESIHISIVGQKP